MTRDCWNELATSGRVSDYLKYREQECRSGQQSGAAVWIDEVANGTDDRTDRYGAVGNACR